MSLLSTLLAQVDNTITVSTSHQVITGTSGDDLFNTHLGFDTYNGGAGNDIVSYAAQGQGIIANLALGTVTDNTLLVTDTLISIENLIGTGFADTLTANTGNFVEGGGGDDLLFSIHGGNTLDGASGNDTVSYANATQAVSVDLSTGLAVGEGTDVLSEVEEMIGSNFNDLLVGDAGDNLISGGLGDDTMRSGGGVDTMVGGVGFDIVDVSPAGAAVTINLQLGQVNGLDRNVTLSGIEGAIATNFDDTLIGNDGANRLSGGGGNDTLEGGMFFDTLDGGSGSDTASYSSAPSAVSVDLQAGAASGGEDDDVLISIENATGSGLADTLMGDDGANRLEGGDGNDLLVGRGGADTLDGGLGVDTATYAAATGGVSVNLSAGVAAGAAGADSLISIENVTGSAFSDFLFGNASANLLVGQDGDDVLAGNAGNDTLDGGAGIDTAGFGNESVGVVASLKAQVANGDGTDTLISIENLSGSMWADTLYGDANANLLRGISGDDVLIGQGGDTLDGGDGSDTVRCQSAHAGATIDLVAGLVTSRNHTITLVSIENAGGGRHGDTMIGNALDNVLRGFGGDDTIAGGDGTDVLDGGGGSDTASYAAAGNKVIVNLAEGYANGGDGHDTLANMENIIGSAFNDGLIGNARHNVIDGGDGNDQITGGLGLDVLTGGAGVDEFIFNSVADSAKHGPQDLITDLSDEDLIDLAGIDADTTVDGDQAFHRVDGFTHHAGEMTLSYKAGRDITVINLDVDGDGRADSVIHVAGDATSFDHFIL